VSLLARLVLTAYPAWFRDHHRNELVDFWRTLEREPRYRGGGGRIRLRGHALGELGVALKLRLRPEDPAIEVLRDGLRLAGVGLAIGLGATALVARSRRSMLYEIAPTDPATYLAVALTVVGVALLATWLPARRASRIDPVRTLDSG